MRAEVIAIGDELTSGERLDTNSQWLSLHLEDAGVPVLFHATVGDDLEAAAEVFRTACQRADIVVSSGGLGPTADDLTRDAIAAAAGVELVLDETALGHIRRLFARRRREMPARNVVQAMFPRGSRVIANPHGTAPGIDLDVPRPGRPACRLFALPGVPAEMHEMWRESVQPAIASLVAGRRRFIQHRALKCYGVGESDLEAMLPDLIRRGRQPRVGITVSRATITLRITAVGDTLQACQEQIEPTAAIIRQCLGELVFGEEDDELQDAVVRLLAQRGQTMATVESGSGGLLADWLSEADPAAGVYPGGWVLRTRLAAAEPAAADPRLSLVAAVEQVREHFATDWALGIGPFPPSDTTDTAPGDLQLVLLGPAGRESRLTPFAGHPDLLRHRAVKQALDLLRLKLLQA